MEEKKQKQLNPRGEVVLADKSEAKSMLQMMNVVIADRDRKRDEKQKFKLRRDKEKGKVQQGQEADPNGPSLVESIFRPAADLFKGETPVVAVDCEMVEVDRCSDGLAR